MLLGNFGSWQKVLPTLVFEKDVAHIGSGAVVCRLDVSEWDLKTAAVSYPLLSKLALLIRSSIKYFSLEVFV
jgi:hypothetical protein